MAEIELTFPDGSKKKFRKGITVLELAEKIGKKLAQDAVAGKVNEELVDLNAKIESNAKVQVITIDSIEGRNILRHSASHLMAQAVKELWPEIKLGIGPIIEEGFYYDFEKKEPFTPEDLKKIEEKMKELAKKDLKLERKELNARDAIKFFEKRGERFKVELLQEMKDEKISVYGQGNFVDLCRGPHIPSTKYLKAFKLLSTAAAYWKGDEKREALQRIYGTAFSSQKELDEFVKMKEEAAKRDHRKIGRELDLYSFNECSPGMPFFHPKGAIIFNELISFLRQEYSKRDYKEVITPLLYSKGLWEQSGHWEHYKDDMFFLDIEGRTFSLKPMNCPSHIIIFKNGMKSYRNLPLRIADFAVLHRNELSGVLGGLFRVRKFSQDDAHIFCTPEQMESEIIGLIDFAEYIYKKVFNFDYEVALSTKPEKAMGDPALWEKAENALKNSLQKKGIKFKVQEGEGAFYGPKIDFSIKDSIGRMWQCATIQLDFQMPERFEATYIGEDSKKHSAVMIHRALLGSLERFIGILVEHYEGKFPLWLSPVQIVVLPVSDKSNEYAGKVLEELRAQGFRVELDDSSETLSYKIRQAQLQKVPFALTVGEKEEKARTIAVRDRTGKVRMNARIEDFISELNKKIKAKEIE
ncbi:MAG: threonine--tRNA ligase [Candidatus Diapherotrites archaeon]